MNRQLLFRISTILLLLFSIHMNMSAETDSTTVTVVKKKRTPREIDPLEEGKRTPARPMGCVISRADGITIGGSHEYFESYEIWDTTGETCLSITYDEASFLDDFFSLPAPFMIILNTSDYSFIGYCDL